jgi:hypothetical protein
LAESFLSSLTVPQLVKKFTKFYGFTGSLSFHKIPSLDPALRGDESNPQSRTEFLKIYFNNISIEVQIFQMAFQILLNSFLISPTFVICLVRLISLNMSTPIKFGESCKLWMLQMCIFLRCPLTLFHLRNRLNASNSMGSNWKHKLQTTFFFLESVKYFHNKVPRNYSSTNKTRIMKSRRMRWAGHVVRMRRRGIHIRSSCERQKRLLKRRRIRTLIIKWILEKWDWVLWIRFIWLRIGTSRILLRTR